MTKKRRNLLIVLAILLLIMLLLWVFMKPKVASVPVQTEVSAPAAPLPVKEKPQVAPLTIRQVPTQTEATVGAVARSFSERYASFSAESKFANIKDLFPIMTDRFRATQEAMMASTETSDTYYGVSSKVLSLETVSIDGSDAIINASLQRSKSVGSATNVETSVEILRMELKNVGEEWLVNDVEWVE
ncbi:MAG: hypothetical protein O2877_01705 [bacterium]|nr:hypothetical protein [bacterium]